MAPPQTHHWLSRCRYADAQTSYVLQLNHSVYTFEGTKLQMYYL